MNTNRIKMSEMKLNIKEKAIKIRKMKKDFKQAERERKIETGYMLYDIIELKRNIRENHVAYSLAKGRTLEQIESKSKLDENGRKRNPLNMSEVNKILLTLLAEEGVTP